MNFINLICAGMLMWELEKIKNETVVHFPYFVKMKRDIPLHQLSDRTSWGLQCTCFSFSGAIPQIVLSLLQTSYSIPFERFFVTAINVTWKHSFYNK